MSAYVKQDSWEEVSNSKELYEYYAVKPYYTYVPGAFTYMFN